LVSGYVIRAIPYQDPQQAAERLKACTRPGSRSSQGLSLSPSTHDPHREAAEIALERGVRNGVLESSRRSC
jgi:hypothetical protein